jgi:hypothetical protein
MTIGSVALAAGLWTVLVSADCRPSVALALALGLLAGVLLRSGWRV